jgi:hypothetical protein
MTTYKLTVAILLLGALFLIGELFVQYQQFSQVSSAYQEARKEHYSPALSQMYCAAADAYMALLKVNCIIASTLLLGAGIYIARLYKTMLLYIPATFLLAAWLFTATLGIRSVERMIFDDYTQNPPIKEFVDAHYPYGWTNAKSHEDAKIPWYDFRSWSPAPFVTITDAGFMQAFTGGVGFRRVYVWWGKWWLIIERETWVS